MISTSSWTPSRALRRASCLARYFAIGSTMRKYTTAAVIRKVSVAFSTEPQRISTPVGWPFGPMAHGLLRQDL